MPEHEREVRQIALLAEYEQTLATGAAATPPSGLDPALATVARLLEHDLGGPRPERAATPDAAFKAALRQRLAEQADAQSRPVTRPISPVAALPVTRPISPVQRDRHGRPTPPIPVVTPSSVSEEPRLRTAAARRAAVDTAPAPARPRPVRAAVATGAGWLGAALVILIVILAATLLLRGLPQSTPAVQPGTTPSIVPTPATNPATPRPAGPTWRSAAEMSTPRTFHTATSLPDGRVLVVGGLRAPIFSVGDLLASAEVYDPASDRWGQVASMSTPRWGHTATLLKDGRVLVAGGYRSSTEGGSLESAEIYDPAADRWSAAASMRDGRTNPTATLLNDGRVLITGGYDYGSGAVTSAEVYDPTTGSWTVNGETVAGGAGQTATLLADGTVLLTGGGDQSSSPSARFNPTTNSWQAAAPLVPGRAGHGAALLPNGQVLIAGGYVPEPEAARGMSGEVVGTDPLTGSQSYDPVGDRWVPAGPIASTRRFPVFVTLGSGQVLALGGLNGAGSNDWSAGAERYDLATDRWVPVGQLQIAREGHTATRLADGRVLVTGGHISNDAATATTELYTDGPVASATPTPRPAGPTWRAAAEMSTPRASHTATLLPDGRVLVTGGLRAPVQSEGDFLASVEIYDPATDRWNPAASMGSPRWRHTATLLEDGRVLVAGGYRGSPEGGSLESVEIYDPRTDRWSAATPMADARADHSAILLNDGRVLIAGGYDYGIGGVPFAEVYDLATGRWDATERFAAVGNGQVATLLRDGRVIVTGGGNPASNEGSPTLRYDPVTNVWETLPGSLTPGRYGHGAALLPDGQVLVVGGQEKRLPDSPSSPSVSGPALATALRYDPVTNRWNSAAPLATVRTNPVLVTLASGQILAIGGFGGSESQGFPAAIERYDPVADRWVTVGQLQAMRIGHTATRLADGRVLVAGGHGGGESSIATAELYTDGPVASATPTPSATPGTAAPLWQATGAMGAPRAKHSATRLDDGRVLVAGGYSTDGQDFTTSAEVYDPQTGRWSGTGAMNVPRYGHRAILLADGQVLVVGGESFRLFPNTTKDGAERYDPATGRWSPTGSLPLGFTPTALVRLNDGRVLAASSPDATAGNKTTATLTLYDPATDQWVLIGNPELPNIGAVVTLRDGTALIVGAVGQEHDGTTPVVRYDPTTGVWSSVAPLPDARGDFTADLLPDGRVLVVGGISFEQGADGVTKTALHNTALLFDPATGQWSVAATMGTARTGHTATSLSDGRVLVVGGDRNFGQAAPTTAELYDPQTGRWVAVGSLTSRARAYFVVAPLANGRAIVTGGDAGYVRSEWLASVDLFAPPARAVVPATPQPTPTRAAPATTPMPTSSGNVDWSSPPAGLLFFGGRGYRLREQTQPNGTGPAVERQLGTTTLRPQSGSVFPAGTPIYSVAGRSSDDWLALKDGDRVYAYQRDDTTTVLLQGLQAVGGTVVDAGTNACPAYGCPSDPGQANVGTIATAHRVTIERSLQGVLMPGTTIEVRQLGTPETPTTNARFAALQPGDRIILFLTPAHQEAIGDFSAGDYYWVVPGWAYRLAGDQVAPIPNFPKDGPVPLADFEVAIVELFRDVTPLAPTDPRPTPRPIPTATGIVPRPTATLPAIVATPTPTPGP